MEEQDHSVLPAPEADPRARPPEHVLSPTVGLAKKVFILALALVVAFILASRLLLTGSG